MILKEVLAPLGVPVCYSPYKGDDRRYITYQSLGQDDVLYADDREWDCTCAYVVNVYDEGPELARLMLDVKHLIEAEGWICTVDPDIYESNVKLHRFPLYCRNVGESYG